VEVKSQGTTVGIAQIAVRISPEKLRSGVRLDTSSSSVTVGQPVEFFAVGWVRLPAGRSFESIKKTDVTVTTEKEGAEYLFRFGDGNASGWTVDSKIKYAYPKPGIYEATVQERYQGILEDSSPVKIEVLESPRQQPDNSERRLAPPGSFRSSPGW
jgi:hypothetical protein